MSNESNFTKADYEQYLRDTRASKKALPLTLGFLVCFVDDSALNPDITEAEYEKQQHMIDVFGNYFEPRFEAAEKFCVDRIQEMTE